jgi:hypothetical protein
MSCGCDGGAVLYYSDPQGNYRRNGSSVDAAILRPAILFLFRLETVSLNH